MLMLRLWLLMGRNTILPPPGAAGALLLLLLLLEGRGGGELGWPLLCLAEGGGATGPLLPEGCELGPPGGLRPRN